MSFRYGLPVLLAFFFAMIVRPDASAAAPMCPAFAPASAAQPARPALGPQESGLTRALLERMQTGATFERYAHALASLERELAVLEATEAIDENFAVSTENFAILRALLRADLSAANQAVLAIELNRHAWPSPLGLETSFVTALAGLQPRALAIANRLERLAAHALYFRSGAPAGTRDYGRAIDYVAYNPYGDGSPGFALYDRIGQVVRDLPARGVRRSTQAEIEAAEDYLRSYAAGRSPDLGRVEDALQILALGPAAGRSIFSELVLEVATRMNKESAHGGLRAGFAMRSFGKMISLALSEQIALDSAVIAIRWSAGLGLGPMLVGAMSAVFNVGIPIAASERFEEHLISLRRLAAPADAEEALYLLFVARCLQDARQDESLIPPGGFHRGQSARVRDALEQAARATEIYEQWVRARGPVTSGLDLTQLARRFRAMEDERPAEGDRYAAVAAAILTGARERGANSAYDTILQAVIDGAPRQR